MRASRRRWSRIVRQRLSRSGLSAEPLEPRQLLAAVLVGQWRADDLNPSHANGDAIAVWSDTVNSAPAVASGQPKLVKDILEGHSVVRFNRADGVDTFLLSALDNPLAGADDFSVAVAFATNAQTLNGGNTTWFRNTGLVDSTDFVAKTGDWGVVITSDGRVGGGLRQPATTVYSSEAGLNDGSLHVVTYTRQGGTISVYVDAGLADSRSGGGTAPRNLDDVTFGAIQGGILAYTGDIAEIRFYDGAFSAAEATAVSLEIQATYSLVRPTAFPDAYNTLEDQTLVVDPAAGVLSNDRNVEALPMTATLIDPPQHGTLTLGEDGSFEYEPNPHFFGTDSFTYRAHNGADSNLGRVELEIAAVYDPARAVEDRYPVLAGEPLTVDAANGVLANDANFDANRLTALLVEDVQHGSLVFRPDGSFDYDPAGFIGTVTFDYLLNDTVADQNRVTVTLKVGTAPVALVDQFQVDEDTELTVPAAQGVLANDTDQEFDSLTAILVDPPQHGALELAADGSFHYDPDPEFSGSDRFTYHAHDGDFNSQVAEVRLDVRAINDAPAALDDVYFGVPDAPLTVLAELGVVSNDLDIDGPILQATLASAPQQGDVELAEDGSFVYTPRPGFTGVDRFLYRATDGADESETAEVLIVTSTQEVVISEAMGRNDETLRDADGDSPDWLELHNPGSAVVDLGGWYLSDSLADLRKWRIPAGVQLAAGGYLVVFASEKDRTDVSQLHTNFRFNSSTDALNLTMPDGVTLAAVLPALGDAPLPEDISYRWDSSVHLRFYQTPTPGEQNGMGFDGLVDAVEFSLPAGFWDSSQQVVLTTTTIGAQIRYTLDGSRPTETHGHLYNEPIAVGTTTTLRAAAFRSGWLPTPVSTQTYLFLQDVIRQPFQPDGLPTFWGQGFPADYGMDPEIVDDPLYADDILVGLAALPTLAISVDPEEFFGRSGLYSNTLNRGMAWERAASAEWIVPDSGRRFQVDAGLRIQGGVGRHLSSSPKQALSLRFRDLYGAGKLNFPLFDDSPVTQFDSLHLRSMFSNSWINPDGAQREVASYIRDQWARDVLIAMGEESAGRAMHSHLYINGIYWGLYVVQERPDENHYAAWFGGDASSLDAFNGNQVIHGTAHSWEHMRTVVQGGDWEAIQQVLDVDAYIDWTILQRYGGNDDLKDNGNWRAAGGGPNHAPWVIYAWDTEMILGSPTRMIRPLPSDDPPGILSHLNLVPEFVVRFGDRVQQHLMHDGPLTPAGASAIWEARASAIELAMIAESARWGDWRRDVARTGDTVYTKHDHWDVERTRLLTEYFPVRTAEVLRQLRDVGLFPAHEAATFSQRGGRVAPGYEVVLTAPQGEIYFTRDGSDPRVTGGAISPVAERYTGPIRLERSTTMLARAWVEGEWSAVDQATFVVAAEAGPNNLRISELHYHPPDPSAAEVLAGHDDADLFEFLELVNISTEAVDLSNVRLAQTTVGGDATVGIAFDFSTSAFGELAPGERVVIAERVDAMRARYGDGIPVAGAWQGRLSNNRETITLLAGDATIQQFSYDDDWHPGTDGQGASLEVVDATAEDLEAWSQAAGWRPSSVLGGTPGEAAVTGDFDGNGRVESRDVDLLQAAIRRSLVSMSLDLTGDGQATPADLEALVEQVLGTRIGDANLDGDVDARQADGVGDGEVLLQNLGRGPGHRWADGDFDGDGYVTGSRDGALLLAALAATPEDTAAVLNQPRGEDRLGPHAETVWDTAWADPSLATASARGSTWVRERDE